MAGSTTVGRKIFSLKEKKPIDILAGILYNKGRSEEERKTLGPTANLHIFKMYGQLAEDLYVQKFFSKKVKKCLTNRRE